MLRFKRRKKKALIIDMAPLVDMVFLLLIFFLLSSSFPQPALRLDLPQGANVQKPKRPEIIITVDRKQNIFVNLEKVTLETLKPTLERMMAETGERKVMFRGDRNIRYGLAFKIADIAMAAGAEGIGLVHQTEIEP